MKTQMFTMMISVLISAALFAGGLFVLGFLSKEWINFIVIFVTIVFGLIIYTKGNM